MLPLLSRYVTLRYVTENMRPALDKKDGLGKKLSKTALKWLKEIQSFELILWEYFFKVF